MAYPKNMPEFVEVDISVLQLGKSIKVEDILKEQYEILNSPLVSIVSVNIPRVKIEIEEDEEEGEEGEEGAEGEGAKTEGDAAKEESKTDEGKDESSDNKEG